MLLVVVYAALLSLQLFLPPVVGHANNGDFERVMFPLGLHYRIADPAERYFQFINLKFDVRPEQAVSLGHASTEYLIGRAARGLTLFVSDAGVLDIRLFGLLHALFAACGIFLLLRSTNPLSLPLRIIIAIALIFIFSDVGYVAPMNSMYMSAASLVFLLCTAGSAALLIRDRIPTPAAVWRFAIFAMLFVTSKPQEAIQALPLAVAAIVFGWRLRRHAIAAAAALLVIGAVYYAKGAPPNLALTAQYHAIYTEILLHSPNPAGDLAALGLPVESLRYRGKHAYEEGSGFKDLSLLRDLHDNFSWAKLAWFYARHPQRAVSASLRALPSAFELRGNFGNHTHEAALEHGRQSESFDFWSSLRVRGASHAGAITLLFASAVIAAIVVVRPHSRNAAIAMLLLVMMATAEFLICALLNAHIELERHLLTFHAMVDLLLVASLGAFAHVAIQRRTERSAAPGSAHA